MWELDNRLDTASGNAWPTEYGGSCGRCQRVHRFENDVTLAQVAMQTLFDQLETEPEFALFREALAKSPGKMIGVLVAETKTGERVLLRAHSGQLAGRTNWQGWVAPVWHREQTAELEAATLGKIAEFEKALAQCDVVEAQRRLDETRIAVQAEAAARRAAHRQKLREWTLEGVDSDRIEAAKCAFDAARVVDAARVEEAKQALLSEKDKVHHLRTARKSASIALSNAWFDSAGVTSARGEKVPLRSLFTDAPLVGGTSDCGIPKLLEAANTAGIRPIALAECWWGPTLNGRKHGDVQQPCDRRCQPLLGHLLCGLNESV